MKVPALTDIQESMAIDTQLSHVLLAFAQIIPEKEKIVSKFSELIVFNLAEGTSNEKRSLFISTGIDMNGAIFINYYIFIPNSAVETFNSICKNAIPYL